MNTIFNEATTDELVTLAALGGGFRISAASRPLEDLERIATAAGQSRTRLVIHGIRGLDFEQLGAIARLGHGCVFFQQD